MARRPTTIMRDLPARDSTASAPGVLQLDATARASPNSIRSALTLPSGASAYAAGWAKRGVPKTEAEVVGTAHCAFGQSCGERQRRQHSSAREASARQRRL